MRVLWTVNTLPPELSKELGISSAHAISWVDAMSRQLKQTDGIQLAIVAAGTRRIKELVCKKIDKIIYYVIPLDYAKKDYWGQILEDFKPDIIHAYGTENRQNINLISNYKMQYPIIISLQGIIKQYIKYYYAGMKMRDIIANITIGDVLLRRSIIDGKHRFKKQLVHEREMIANISYVEGRSDWDRVYSKSINRTLKYYHCPRMIRSEFFDYKWKLEQCEKHSILVHQGSYPIKGLHMMLDALVEIKKEYPDVIMYIAGNIDFHPKTLKRKLLFNGYTKYIKKRIRQLGLSDNIRFTGYLNAEKMAEKLSSVSVCVIPSAIENVPNALAEAMIVGTPCVASYVGGSPDLLNNGECGLMYRYDEPEMLAYRVMSYFENNALSCEKSENAIRVARERHAPKTLVECIIGIYTSVIDDFTRSQRLNTNDKK
jgi:glycosyltransferase involved in cell wall biosynthesis